MNRSVTRLLFLSLCISTAGGLLGETKKITFDEAGFPLNPPLCGSVVSYNGANFRGGFNVPALSGDRYYYSCYSEISIYLPPHSRNISIDVGGQGYWMYSPPVFAPVKIYDGPPSALNPYPIATVSGGSDRVEWGKPVFTSVSISETQTGVITLTAQPMPGYWPAEVFIDNVSFTPPDTRYIVKASVATDSLPIFERKAGASTVTVPLGAEFAVGLEKGVPEAGDIVGTQVTAQFTLSDQAEEPVATSTLFANTVVFSYAPKVHEVLKKFQAVHLGEAKLSILPDGDAQPTTLTVKVVPPAHLGADTLWVDDDVIKAAHMTGMLPQNVKGQMRQESPGQIGPPDNYVYEPCRDLDTVQPLITTDPYVHFTSPDPKGDQLQSEDLNPRNQYNRLSDDDLQRLYGNGQPLTGPPYPSISITGADTNIPIASIFAANDCRRLDKTNKCHGANWSSTCPGVSNQIKANNYAGSRMVAQTPLAASYGWLQVMYYEAITEGWLGAIINASTGERSRAPHYLFDTKSNLANEGGTLFFGNYLNAKHYKTEVGDWGDANAFTTSQAFDKDIRLMYHVYNRAWHSKTGSTPYYNDYESAVLDYAKQYLPIRKDSILK